MSVLDRLRGRARPALPLAVVVARLGDRVPWLERAAVDRPLVLARLADGYRSADLAPAPPAALAPLIEKLDEEGARRWALLVATLDEPAVRAALPKALPEGGVAAQIQAAFLGPAAALDKLTLELLRQSAIRLEELARHFLAGLRVAIAGESEAQSTERLARIDYARLLAEAERAREHGEEKNAALKKQLQDAKRARGNRGKW